MQYRKIVVDKSDLIEVTNIHGLKMVLSANGAGLVSIHFNDEIMTISPKSLILYKNHQMFNGKTIAPIFGFVPNGILEINGMEFDLNKNYSDESKIHNGEYSLNNYVFSPKMNFGDKMFTCIFSVKKKKNSDGLPGNIKYFVTYAMSDASNEIFIDYRAMSDDITPISITNHTCFCLGSSNLETLYLTIPSEEYLDIDKEDMTYQEYKHVDAVMDFQKKKSIGKYLHDSNLVYPSGNGYQHYYLLKKRGLPIILENAKYRLEVESDYEGAHIYSDNLSSDIEMQNTDKKDHRGVVIAPNINPKKLYLLRKGETYHHQITYRFIKK